MVDIAGQQPSAPVPYRAVLAPHRSLGPRGFLILMGSLCAVSFGAGIAFWAIGAWPVMGFFGLDVAAIYLAFRLNYRSGRLREFVEVSPDVLTVTRVEPSGRRTAFTCNPYWARVSLREWPDGRNDLRILAQGAVHSFGRCLTDDERREFAQELKGALITARGGIHF